VVPPISIQTRRSVNQLIVALTRLSLHLSITRTFSAHDCHTLKIISNIFSVAAGGAESVYLVRRCIEWAVESGVIFRCASILFFKLSHRQHVFMYTLSSPVRCMQGNRQKCKGGHVKGNALNQFRWGFLLQPLSFNMCRCC